MSTAAATRFDRWLTRTPQGRFYAWLTSVPGAMVYNTPAYKLHEELQLHPENRVLDIGCGRGALLQLLETRVTFRKPPVGVDVSRAILRLAEGESERLQASPEALPLADESFDVVTCGYVTQHLDEAGVLALLREVRRVLTHGGIALVWDFSPTRSRTLNAFHERVLALTCSPARIRGYTSLSALALEAGFEWVSNAHLRPFLFPPIPRVSIIVGKAPIGWQPDDVSGGLTPDTHARSIVAGVTREGFVNQ